MEWFSSFWYRKKRKLSKMGLYIQYNIHKRNICIKDYDNKISKYFFILNLKIEEKKKQLKTNL